MKQVAIKSTVDMLQKIETIEKEVMDLKVSVLKKLAPAEKKVISLKGIFKKVDITEEDIYPVRNIAVLLCPVHHAVQGSAAR